MFKVDAAAFHAATVVLCQAVAVAQTGDNRVHMSMSQDSADCTKSMLSDRLVPSLQPLNVPVTKLALRDLLRTLDPVSGLTYFSCGQLLLNLSETLRRELETATVLSVDGSRAHFYEPSEPLFGIDVASKFPGITYDIDQAGKCYACDLTTASAFHSIRCLEAGIRSVSRCLGIPDQTKGSDRNWSNILRLVKVKIDSRWPTSGRMSGDGKVFDEIHGAMAAIQNPYRNATMHLDATYTAPESLHIFEVVKGLMWRIASRMDEQGLPLA
jgi:hypothetical protein